MNGVSLALRTLHTGERNLADEFSAAAERHRTEHEVHHVATDLAAWSRRHVEMLSDAAADHGLDLGEDRPIGSTDGLFASLRQKAAEVLGRRPEPGLLLLRDLRELHLHATESSLHWEMLAQVAQATGDDNLLRLASDCHPQTLRQMRWTNTMIKVLSPQILAGL